MYPTFMFALFPSILADGHICAYMLLRDKLAVGLHNI